MSAAKPVVTRIGDALDKAPRAWHLIQVLRYRNSRKLRKLVTPEHDVVLEGFPRSGNSFADRAFVYANPRVQQWAIATHAHRIAQIALAVRYRLPTAIFVREPDQAITSYAALSFGSAMHDRERIQDFIAEKTRYYARYYTFVIERQELLVISDFSTTTKAYGRVIAALNGRFGTDFMPFSDDPADVAAIFASTKVHLSPNVDRETVKQRMLELYLAPANARAREHAEDIYSKIRQVAL